MALSVHFSPLLLVPGTMCLITSAPSICSSPDCTWSIPLLFALCLQHAHFVTRTSACSPPAAASIPVPRPLLHCSPGDPERQHGVALNACSRAGIPGCQGWWGEDILQKDIFNISVALARNELEMPILQWLELDGSVLGENSIIPESASGRCSR